MLNNITVTMPSSALRRLGRESLHGQWGKAIAGAIVYLGVIVLPVLILGTLAPEDGNSAEALFYTLFMSGPFTLGYMMIVLGIFRKDPEVSPSWVFYGWERTFKSIGLFIVIMAMVSLGCLLLIVPGIIISIRYSQVFYIFADHPDWGLVEILQESARLMKGNYAKYFFLQLSFIGWVLLAAAVGGLLSSAFTRAFLPQYSTNMIESGFAALAQIPTFSKEAMLYCLSAFLGYAGYFVLLPYMSSTGAVLYDILNGNLRPRFMNPDITVVSDAKDGFDRTDDYFDAVPVGSREYYERMEEDPDYDDEDEPADEGEYEESSNPEKSQEQENETIINIRD